VRSWSRCAPRESASWTASSPAWSRADPAGNHALISDVLARIAAGELHPVAPESYPLERAAQALSALARRQVAGKLALLP